MTSAEFMQTALVGTPESQAALEAQMQRLLDDAGIINPDVRLPDTTGVVRFDSDTDTDVDLSRLPQHIRAQIHQLRANNPACRILITQTAPWPGDDDQARRNLIEAKHGLRLVE